MQVVDSNLLLLLLLSLHLYEGTASCLMCAYIPVCEWLRCMCAISAFTSHSAGARTRALAPADQTVMRTCVADLNQTALTPN